MATYNFVVSKNKRLKLFLKRNKRNCVKYDRVQRIIKLMALVVYRKLPSNRFAERNIESINFAFRVL